MYVLRGKEGGEVEGVETFVCLRQVTAAGQANFWPGRGQTQLYHVSHVTCNTTYNTLHV